MLVGLRQWALFPFLSYYDSYEEKGIYIYIVIVMKERNKITTKIPYWKWQFLSKSLHKENFILEQA